ncbi:MAG: L-glyceraldehyde 3-phosphate reductase, partial [Clostridia bacterium]|nr:L-glyceraldehyde 3-phosphate reductase [Clostridia bacterium]
MYRANPARYSKMPYNRLGRSGLKLPAISLGLWQNFGVTTSMYTVEEMLLTAFDGGIVHFDLANNY